MRLTNNSYFIRNFKETIQGTVSGIYFYKYKTVNEAIKEYAQKFDNWRDLYFKDLKLTKDQEHVAGELLREIQNRFLLGRTNRRTKSSN